VAKKLNIAVWRGEGKPLLQYLEDNTDLRWASGESPTSAEFCNNMQTLVLCIDDDVRYLRYSEYPRSNTISPNRFIQYLKDGDETGLPFDLYF